MKRWRTEIEQKDGNIIVMDVKLTFGGWLLFACAFFSSRVLFWLPPIEQFKQAIKRHTLFRLNGGPWVRYTQELQDILER